MHHRTNGLSRHKSTCSVLGSLIRAAVLSVCLSQEQVSVAWPTISPSSVSPNSATSSSRLKVVVHSRSGFTCQGNEFSLFMLLTSSFILNRFRSHLTLNFRSLTKKNDTIEQNPSTSTCCIPTSIHSPTYQKQAHCFARSRYPTCYLQTFQPGRTFQWSQVRVKCDASILVKLNRVGVGGSRRF